MFWVSHFRWQVRETRWSGIRERFRCENVVGTNYVFVGIEQAEGCAPITCLEPIGIGGVLGW